MFECPSCGCEAKTLVIPQDGKLGCRSCVTMRPKPINVNLGQTVERWNHVDKKGIEHKHRLTVGKDWEINNRVVSRDDKMTVINRVTGKEAQY